MIRSGFKPRCAAEVDDSAQVRLVKIQDIIAECRYGIHDLSRTESDGEPPLPRFNMPLELGLFLGAKRYGPRQQTQKRALVLDTQPYRYQRFISDIAGQDIHAHGGDPVRAAKEVAIWLRQQSRSTTIPGGARIGEEFATFSALMSDIIAERQLSSDEMTFGDFVELANTYVTGL